MAQKINGKERASPKKSRLLTMLKNEFMEKVSPAKAVKFDYTQISPEKPLDSINTNPKYHEKRQALESMFRAPIQEEKEDEWRHLERKTN